MRDNPCGCSGYGGGRGCRKKIKEQIHIPLVVDIHFDYKLALESMKNGADKVRINPGNIGGKERVKAVVDMAKAGGNADKNRRKRRLA